MVTSGGANFSVMTVSPRRKWYRPVSAETGCPCRANRVPGRTLGGRTAFQRTQVLGVAAYAVQRENLMQATHAQCQPSQDSFPALAGSGSLPGKHAQVEPQQKSGCSRSIAIRCKPSSVRTSPPKTSLA